jgi:hypothetical protein
MNLIKRAVSCRSCYELYSLLSIVALHGQKWFLASRCLGQCCGMCSESCMCSQMCVTNHSSINNLIISFTHTEHVHSQQKKENTPTFFITFYKWPYLLKKHINSHDCTDDKINKWLCHHVKDLHWNALVYLPRKYCSALTSSGFDFNFLLHSITLHVQDSREAHTFLNVSGVFIRLLYIILLHSIVLHYYTILFYIIVLYCTFFYVFQAPPSLLINYFLS